MLRRVVFLLLLALAACSRGESPEVRQCLATLNARGVSWSAADAPGSGSGCGIAGGVQVRQLSTPFNQPATMSCALALAMNDFETQVVQPAALRHFGKPVAQIRHFGAYACRPSTGTRGRLSEHAKGDAIDVNGFVLSDGTTIEVKKDWYGADARTAFLREVAQGACQRFNLVLTPNSNRDHWDHFHLDVGRYRECGA